MKVQDSKGVFGSLCLRSILSFALLFLGMATLQERTLLGQGSERDVWGYGFAGVGASYWSGANSEGNMHFGVGGEGLVAEGFGLGVELGYLSDFNGEGIGVLSPGVLYAFNREKDTVPFITGGYSLFFRSATASGVFFGGGVNKWIGERWGVRIEGRDQVYVAENVHFLEARFAFIFR